MIIKLILILVIQQFAQLSIDLVEAQQVSISLDSSSFSPVYGQLVNILNGHSKRVLRIAALGTNQDLLASSSNDTTVKIWNTTSGQMLKNLQGHLLNVWALAYLGNNLLASGSVDRTIKIWDITTGNNLRTLPNPQCITNRRVCSWNSASGHTNNVNTLGVMTGTLLVSGSFDKTVRVWDYFIGELKRTYVGHTKTVKTVLYLPSNSLIASVGFDGTVRIWDYFNSASTSAKYVLSLDASPINTVVDLNDGRIASAGNNSLIAIWNTNTGQLIHTFTDHTDIVHALVLSSNGYLISGSKDKTVRVWDVTSYSLVKTFTPYVSAGDKGHRASVYRLISLKNSLVASFSFDKTIKLWDTKTLANFLTYSNSSAYGKTSHTSDILTASYLHERVFATGSKDDSIRVWRYDFHYLIFTFKGHTRFVLDVTALENGYVASCSVDYLVKIWNGNPGQGALVWTTPYKGLGHSKQVNAVIYVRDTIVASGSDDFTVKIWNWTSKSLLATFNHTQKVNTLLLLHDGRLASGSNDDHIQIYTLDFENNVFTQTARWLAHNDSVQSLAQLANDNLISASFDYTARIWRATDFSLLYTLTNHTDGIYNVQVFPNSYIATGSFDGSANVWNGLTGQLIYNFVHPNDVTAVEIDTLGRLVTGSSDTLIRVFDLATGNLVKTLSGHTSGIITLQAMPGAFLLSGSGDASIRIWDLSQDNAVAVYDQSIGGHTSSVNSLTQLSNGVTFASGSNDNTVKVWLNYQYY